MNYQMVLKGASAKAQEGGGILVRLVLEIESGIDMASDIISEAGGMLDQRVNCSIEQLQMEMPIKKGGK